MSPFLRVAPGRAPVTAVYGGGGLFGIAYGLGVAHAMQDLGVPLETCSAIGTSAGSWVAASVATGLGFDAMEAQPEVRVPNLKPGWLRSVAAEVFGDARSSLVRASALRLPTLRRELLHDLPLADLVSASSSVPGVFAPASVQGHLYVDGGVRSLASADLAPEADHLLVVAPLAGGVLGLGGRSLEVLLGRELHRWEHRTGGRAHLVRPNAAIARLVSSPAHLFDKARAVDVYPLAYQQASELMGSRPGLVPLAA